MSSQVRHERRPTRAVRPLRVGVDVGHRVPKMELTESVQPLHADVVGSSELRVIARKNSITRVHSTLLVAHFSRLWFDTQVMVIS